MRRLSCCHVDGQSEQSAPPPPWRKMALLAAVVAALLAIVYLSPLRAYLGHARDLSESIRRLGLLAPLAMTLGVAALVAVGVPRLLFCFISGMAFGFWWGLLWAQLGTLLGNYVMFMLARRGAHNWAQQYLSRRGRLHDFIRQESIAGVILARQLPLPGLVINLACGLLPLRHRDYLLGTLIGQLPQAVPATLLGAGTLQTSFLHSTGLIALAVVCALALWLALRWLLRARAGHPPNPSH